MGPSSCSIISDLLLSHALNWEPLINSSCRDKDRLQQDTGICSFLLVIKVSASILESIILTPSLWDLTSMSDVFVPMSINLVPTWFGCQRVLRVVRSSLRVFPLLQPVLALFQAGLSGYEADLLLALYLVLKQFEVMFSL